MIARSTVPFAQLRQLVEDLGFSVRKRGKGWNFEHLPSETWFTYRPYRTRERITVGDLHVMRKPMDWRGVLAPEDFDERLKTAST